MPELKSQAILDAEREYQEAERIAQAAIDAQNTAKKRLNLLEMEAEYGIRIGDTLEWIEPGRSQTHDGWHFSSLPDKSMKGLVVDNEWNWPVVQLYKKDGTLGKDTKRVPPGAVKDLIITHAPEASHVS
jgi:hypothetical protein